MRKLYVATFFILLLFTAGVYAQSGAVKGKIIDKEKKEVIPFANVVLELNGVIVGGAVTDFDGNYTIKPVPPGKYTLKSSNLGYQPAQINSVIVSSDKITFIDVEIASQSVNLKEIQIIEYAVPLISKDNTQTGAVITRDQILTAPTRDINALASQAAGVYQQDDGKGINMRGQRSEGTFYIIDGIKVRGSVGLPQSGIEQISVITGGVPAQYGDLTGGIVNITTRGPSKDFSGGVELISSQFLDDYGYNLVNASLSGPIWLKKDTINKVKTPVLGFALAGEFQYDKDANPSAVGSWKIKDEKLKSLQENPLRRSKVGSGFDRSSEFLTSSDFEHIAARQNVMSHSFRLNGKLDFQPTRNITLTTGGSWDRNNSKDNVYINGSQAGTDFKDIYNNSLLNYYNNPLTISDSWRVFGRFTQKLGEQKENSSSIVKNFYYTVQADYSKFTQTEQNENHKDKFFNYGHVGKFKTYKAKSYETKRDTVNGESLYGNFMTSADKDTLYTFEASQYNPLSSVYTAQFYNNYEGKIETSNDVRNGGGLLNGDPTKAAYSLWNNTGTVNDNYNKIDNSQIRLSAMGSFDIKNHAITAGFELEQRIERRYQMSPRGLWPLMKQLANKHITQLDKAHGHAEYDDNGVFMGTVDYDRLYVDSLQANFDKNLRKELGLAVNGKEWIDIDSYDPSTFKLSMFSADELLNNGNQLIKYYGYDYLGNKTDETSFANYFTKKDDQGNFLRNSPAFQPIYVAGYIQDKFAFNDLVFNIGLRVDKFDANQKVLRDKYSLYPIHTAAESQHLLKPGESLPSNIGSDYSVYVNDINNPTSIVGYRNGDIWYNDKGEEISDPKVLAEATSAGRISPYLVNSKTSIRSENFNAFSSFKNYDPQYNFMPRIQFSFPISDEAQFFAHYDVLTQRPLAGTSRLDPFNYLWLESITTDVILTNPDLKPERTTDYEIGFKQKVSKTSALTISAFYKEMRDMIQVIAVNYAYPVSYKTYGNKDFGNVKGITLSYDLRRTENVRLNANYTLQFAEGTGSSFQSSQNLITAGFPNLRTPFPLDFDQRHNVVVSFDYRVNSDGDYRGPVLFGKQILAGFGANIVLRAGSGVPYTQQSNITQGDPVTSNVVIGVSQRTNLKGGINSSRLPWQYRIDAKIDKNFMVEWGKKTEGEKRKAFINVYLQIQNVLNAANIIKVYSYTGNPNDDGYLSSSSVQNAIAGQLNEQSYRDLYALKVNDPNNYSLPRRIRLGLVMNF